MKWGWMMTEDNETICTCKRASQSEFSKIRLDIDKNGIYKYCPKHSSSHEFWIKNLNSHTVEYVK